MAPNSALPYRAQEAVSDIHALCNGVTVGKVWGNSKPDWVGEWIPLL